ncbi:hypothetical protein CPB83DRAFT_944065 [Crepidotus variabilis]|uniref:DUF6534 domain-containing protein n=1 Tax=Crepidotus variabilis TaxID=179855 RepID=A0A9P6EAG5_9AGAR|nr:hypothetical protein CPB83DRAFT_944065 [Crepidotus variabilis]
MLNWSLFGVLSMQMYIYYVTFGTDPLHNKLLAYGVYLLEVIQTILLTQSCFHAFAQGFGDFNQMDEIGTLWFSVPTLSGVVACVAQLFYAYRIHILARSKFIVCAIIALSVLQLGGGIATAVMSKRAIFHSHFLGPGSYKTTGVSQIWNGSSMLCDVIIAICMIVCLSHRMNGLPSTRKLVKKIILLTVETGSITAVVALLNFILVLLPTRPTYFLTPVAILGKLYSNSMMAVFNSRIHFSMANEQVSSADPPELAHASLLRPRLQTSSEGR